MPYKEKIMFKRVTKIDIEGWPDPIISTATYESLEVMRADRFGIEGENNNVHMSIEEYEDDKLLRSLEVLDPTRSSEFSVSTIDNNPKYFGIKVDIKTSDEHGELLNYKTPAHVHVSTNDGMALCKLNITGECPLDNNSVVKCIFDIKTKKVYEYSKNMVTWANYVRTTPRGKIKNWDYAKVWWKENIESIGKNQDEIKTRKKGNGIKKNEKK
jgi:hypothetical protein